MIWFKCPNLYNRSMEPAQENTRKVQLKLAELNTGLNPAQWVSADGFSALTGFKFGKTNNDSQFLASSGVPVKVFFNNVTGEVKIFLAVLFRD